MKTVDELIAERVQTFVAPIVPPTMLATAGVLGLSIVVNWRRGSPNVPQFTVTMLVGISVILVLAFFLRSVASQGLVDRTSQFGIVYVAVLATTICTGAHYTEHGVMQSMPYCIITAIAGLFFWAHTRHFVFGTICALTPPVVQLFLTEENADKRFVFAQLALYTALICVGFHLLVRLANRKIYRLSIDLEQRASIDGLTGLFNRAYWVERASEAVEQSPSSLLFIDVDRFKEQNDLGGHACGDLLLGQIANVIRGQSQTGQLAGRIGGDEFVLLLPGYSREAVQAIAEAIEQEVAALDSMPLRAGVSIGFAESNQTEDLDSLIKRADHAMFEAKRKRRDLTLIPG